MTTSPGLPTKGGVLSQALLITKVPSLFWLLSYININTLTYLSYKNLITSYLIHINSNGFKVSNIFLNFCWQISTN